jgi:hypothetical protein
MPTRIVSGGQTGVDRAALDVAIELSLRHGGWCPRGRRAEDGCIHPRYLLQETSSANYAVRTEQNVIDSDATLIIYRKPLSGGTKLTLRYAQKHGRPSYLFAIPSAEPQLQLDLGGDIVMIAEAEEWLRSLDKIETLNVAGPRSSTQPGIYEDAVTVLTKLLTSYASVS